MTKLDEMKARLAKATPGPWEYYEVGYVTKTLCVHAKGIPICRSGYAHDPKQHGDMDLIANAPTDIERLIKALEECVMQRNAALIELYSEQRDENYIEQMNQILEKIIGGEG